MKVTHSASALIGATLLTLGISALAAGIVTVPPGLNPGDQYRLVFVTSTEMYGRANAGGGTGPTSINDFNNFGSNTAVAVSALNGLNTTWKAIVSVRNANGSLVRAKDNTGTASGTGVPFYNLAGQLVSPNNTALWSGALSNAINVTELGTDPAPQSGGYYRVHTGMNDDGTANADWSLCYPTGGYALAGNPTTNAVNFSNNSPPSWCSQLGEGDPNAYSYEQMPIYVMSDILTVPAVTLVTVPADLNPGDQYRLVFVTSTETYGWSGAGGGSGFTSIAQYNTFASNTAVAVPVLSALNTSWKAVVATYVGGVVTSAKANTGTDPSVNGTGVPLYNLRGQRVANNNSDLWDGSIQNPINLTELGLAPALQYNNQRIVWSGMTDSAGNGNGDQSLITPSGGYIRVGDATAVDGTWASTLGTGDPNARKSDLQPIYAMSGVLTVTANTNCDILTFNWGTNNATIVGTNVTLPLPYGTAVTSLNPTYTVSLAATGSPASGTTRDFTTPQTYTVVAGDGVHSNVYLVTVTVAPASTNCDMLTFTWGGRSGTISGTNVTLVVTNGTPVTSLNPAYTVSADATGAPASGTTQDFSTPQTYTITAQDGVSTKTYRVAILVGPLPVPPGLNPGDQYRLVFVTSAETYGWGGANASAFTTIAQYNAFASNTAVAVPALLALNTTWKAIIATETPYSSGGTITSAKTITETGTGTVPFYNLAGQRVANNDADLWDGTIQNPINMTELGTHPALQYNNQYLVWTGMTDGSGNGNTDQSLITPSGGYIRVGDATATNNSWASTLGSGDPNARKSDLQPIYAMSGVLTVPLPGSTNCDLLSFNLGTNGATIVGTNVTLTVPYGTPLTSLNPTYVVSPNATGVPPSGTFRDFTTPQTYTVTAEDGVHSNIYLATVTWAAASTACDLLTFNWGIYNAAINGTNVILTVPHETDVTALNPTCTISPLATVLPASGSTQNFAGPQIYTVTAQDGTTTKGYLVTVYQTPPPGQILTVPHGLNVGDQYRLVFVTSTETYGRANAGGGTGPTSINDLNTFATTTASAAPALNALGTTWKAMVSVRNADGSTVSAKSNTGTDSGAGVPIYNLAGLLVAGNNTLLWSSALSSPINVTELGTGPAPQSDGYYRVHTGMTDDGSASGDWSLCYPTGGYALAGNPTSTVVNFANNSPPSWCSQLGEGDPNAYSYEQMPIYVISEVLTVTANRAPVATDVEAGTLMDQIFVLHVAKLLMRASDPDGDALTVTSVTPTSTNGGTVTLDGTNITYTPPLHVTGADRFSFEISDGHGGTATADVFVTINLTSGLNLVRGPTFPGDGTARLTFAGIPHYTYELQRSLDLTNWVSIATNVAPVNGQLECTDPTPPPGQAFYRTRSP